MTKKKRPRGRPKSSASSRNGLVAVVCYVSPETAARVRAMCSDSGLTRGELLASLLAGPPPVPTFEVSKSVQHWASRCIPK